MILGIDFMGRFDSVSISLRAPSKDGSKIQEQYIDWKPYKGTPCRWRLHRRPEPGAADADPNYHLSTLRSSMIAAEQQREFDYRWVCLDLRLGNPLHYIQSH